MVELKKIDRRNIKTDTTQLLKTIVDYIIKI